MADPKKPVRKKFADLPKAKPATPKPKSKLFKFIKDITTPAPGVAEGAKKSREEGMRKRGDKTRR